MTGSLPTAGDAGHQMKLPNGEAAVVDERKARDYLLSSVHPVGRFKARYFARIGFTRDHWVEFVAALRDLALTGDATLGGVGHFGKKFIVRGDIAGLRGGVAAVDSIWIIRPGDDRPHLVTVYPRQP